MGYNNGYDEGVPPAADIVQLLWHAPVVFTIRNFRYSLEAAEVS